MFGFLAKCFKTELMDPLDKSLIKTVQRIQDVLYTFFKENSKLVWRACAISLQEILENCFPSPTAIVSEDKTPVHLIFDPLLGFLTSGNNPM